MTSHTNKNLSKNIQKKTINQTDLVLITFGVLLSKEINSEKVSPKQNGGRRKIMYLKSSMGNGASASIIHYSYVNGNNLITRKTSANKWSTMVGSFSTSRKTEIR